MKSPCRIVLLAKNPGSFAPRWVEACKSQDKAYDVLVIDSGSSDGSREVFSKAGFHVHPILPTEFNHGKTRQLACDMSEGYEFLVYMTQDALLASPTSIAEVVKPFEDSLVAAVCGRQLPHVNANPLAIHARQFNYPTTSQCYSAADIPRVGVKAAFMSNSFAAYRRSHINKIGGWPKDVIFGEDFQIACRFLQAGLKVAYCAESVVFHSHNYSPATEFRRYFDVGVSHRDDYWMIEYLGKASGEGLKFVLSEMKFLLKQNPLWIPCGFIQNVAKFVGYKCGLNYPVFSQRVRKKISYDPGYWDRRAAQLEAEKAAP